MYSVIQYYFAMYIVICFNIFKPYLNKTLICMPTFL